MKLIYILSLLFSSLFSFTQALIPNPPQLSATSYLLLDAKTLKVISEDNSNQSTGLASITKIMTAYVVADQINKGFLKNDVLVKISEKCWRTEGSRMFVKEGTEVSVEDLMLGVIVQSGNDASCALAEHIAGSEYDFSILMNEYAKKHNSYDEWLKGLWVWFAAGEDNDFDGLDCADAWSQQLPKYKFGEVEKKYEDWKANKRSRINVSYIIKTLGKV